MAELVLADEGLDPDTLRRQRVAMVLIGVLALLHIALVWGYAGLFWGEHGRWLAEVSRYAGGEVAYRDFSWSYPPLALWIVGGVARLTGTTLAAISATMVVFYLLIVALFLLHLKRLMPQLVLPIALPAILCAAAYASRTGVPLPLGTVSPSGPVGFLCLLGAAALMLNAVDHLSRRAAVFSGALAGLAMLSAQDYWLPAGYALLAGTALLVRRRAATFVLVAPLATCAVTVVAGAGVAIAQAGLLPFVRMLISSDDLGSLAIRALPSFERLTVEVAATAALSLIAVTALWLCLAISDRVAARWAGALACVFFTAAAIHLGTSMGIGRELTAHGPVLQPTNTEEMMWLRIQSGRSLAGSALVLFDERLQVHLFPALLPPILLGVLVARWRAWHDRKSANRLALLLGLAVVARIHPGFEAEWHNVLLELPCFALFLQLICGPARQKAARAVRAALSVVILLGLYSEVSMGRGALTLSGSFPVTETHAGPVRWPRTQARTYREADSLVTALDPGGQRPLFAFGATGGWNYFLGRANPSPATGGVASGPWPVDTVLNRLRRANPPVILLDNGYAKRAVRGPVSRLLRWEPEPQPNQFLRRDREPFERLATSCQPVVGDSLPDPIAIFDCARPSVSLATRPGTTP